MPVSQTRVGEPHFTQHPGVEGQHEAPVLCRLPGARFQPEPGLEGFIVELENVLWNK